MLGVVSICVPIALECRALHKRFVTGVAGCSASAQVLRGADLALRAGECLAIVGAPGAGKSTLLLCAAGLLRPDSGEIRWFGETSLGAAAQRVVYHGTFASLGCTAGGNAPIVHLVDVTVPHDWWSRLGEWIDVRREHGDAVLLAAPDQDMAHALASRLLLLRGGRLGPCARAESVSRVAEPVSPQSTLPG